MSNHVVDITFRTNGHPETTLDKAAKAAGNLNVSVLKVKDSFVSLSAKLFAFQSVANVFDQLKNKMNDLSAPGIAVNSQLADLSAIAGVTGAGLKEIEGYARQTAKTFGGSAAQAIESYKLILSQLSPEIAKSPKAMKLMGDNIATLSKTMDGDATAAAEVLTTAMNQYGVSLDNPIQASKVMSGMMNIMAAAGKEGSAELPAIKQALEQCGMAARSAGVSFSETNAAIQVLDKAGKKGSEGGVALRNVMSTLAQGRFLPKEVKEELSAAGVDVNTLTDKSKSLTDRLDELKPIMQDTALLTKIFGTENANAAMALLSGNDEIERLNDAISGTNAAEEQAAVIMAAYAEKQARMQARIDDMKISLFNVTGGLTMFVSNVASSITPIVQLMPLVTGLGTAFNFVKAKTILAYTSLGMYNGYLSIGQVANMGFTKNVIQAAVAVGRFAVVGLWNAIKGIGFYIASLVTGGTASASFAAISSTAFATFATAGRIACTAISTAIYSIPIVGWIALAITLIAAAFTFIYKKCDKFAAVMNGVAAGIKAIFTGGSYEEAYAKAYSDKMKERAEERARKDKEEGDGGQGDIMQQLQNKTNEGNTPPDAGVNTSEAIATGGTRNTQITINLGKMVENIVFNGGLAENKENMTKQVEEAMYRVLLSAQSAG